MNITILACGKIKKGGDISPLLDHYKKQFKWSVTVKEISVSQSDPVSKQREENKALCELIVPGAYVIVLDETGVDLTSRQFADIFKQQQDVATKHVHIIIGGADGLLPEVMSKASKVIRLGKLTWPHKMVRLMVFEQLYRAQSILDGHPYHRD